MLEKQEGRQSGWGVHRECWNSVNRGQEGQKGKSWRPCRLREGAWILHDELWGHTEGFTSNNTSWFMLPLFSHQVMSASLWSHILKCARLPYPSLSPRVCSNFMSIESVMLSKHPILCHPLFLLHSIFPSISFFPNEMALCQLGSSFRWPKYWSFSFSNSPSNKYLGLISFRIDWFWSPNPRASQESYPAPQFGSISSSVLSLLYGSSWFILLMKYPVYEEWTSAPS